MASLTIRKLDDAIKSYLRLRSAKNGRSVEEEVRVILREYCEGSQVPAATASAPADRPAAQPVAVGSQASVTLIIGGGIAAYKALDLIRRLKERHIDVRCVLTKAAQQFVTPLAASALSHERVYTDLFDPGSEFDAGHIRLARECDLIVVAPATADLMAKMAQGHADDLASAILLAANRPILLAPAMNPLMWNNAATRRNVLQLRRDGIQMIGPNAGEMAEAGEAGVGRMSEAIEIAAAAVDILRPPRPRPLAGKRVLITAGPTHEPIDPVRYIANRSSGKQGYAIAAAAQAAGADVTLVSGPVDLRDPAGRHGDPRGIGARHAASGGSGIAGRYRDLRRSRRRLARRQRRRAEAEEDLRRNAAATTGGKPGHSGHDLEAKGQAPAAGNRLCRRDRAPYRQRQGQDRAQGLRLDRRQRRFARDRRDGRRPQHRPFADPRRRRYQRRFLARDDQGTGRDRTGRENRKQGGAELVSATVKVDICQLPHGEGLALPAYQSADAAGLDLLAAVPADTPLILPPGKYAMVPTALTIALPPGYEAQVRPRSGLAAKHGVTVLNSPGTVDADYRGEINVLLINHGEAPFPIRRGERIAQMVIAPVVQAELVPVTSLSATDRGSGGFGSTGR